MNCFVVIQLERDVLVRYRCIHKKILPKSLGIRTPDNVKKVVISGNQLRNEHDVPILS